MAQADSAAPGSSGLKPAITHDLIAVLWRRRWVALAAFVAVVAGVAALTASLPKVYDTTAYMLVNPSRPADSDFEQTQISEALLTTYAELLQTQTVADEVARRLGSEAEGEGNLKDAIYRYPDRHRVKSGLTGWAQVNGLRGETSLADRIEWDNFYIENWSPWLDLKILVKTIPALLAGRGAS